MNIFLFVVFIFTDLFIVGIFAFTYSGIDKYKEGMILGVHIPKIYVEHPEVVKIAINFKKNLKCMNIINLIIGIAIGLISFWDITFFIIIWMIWLFAYIIWMTVLLYSSHRKMYRLKVRNKWILENGMHMIYIDTVVSAMSNAIPFKLWWHFPAIIISAIFLFLPYIREYFELGIIYWLFPGMMLWTSILFCGFQRWLVTRKNNVYSKDSSINLAINCSQKRTWSLILIISNYCNLASWCYLVYKIYKYQWFSSFDFIIFILFQIVTMCIIAFGFLYSKKKQSEILNVDSASILVDDDEYWKNGWYNNPKDPHLWVQDRLCSMNLTMNYGRPVAKVIMLGTIIFTVGILIWIFSLIYNFEHANITLRQNDNKFIVHGAMYTSEFQNVDIKSVELMKDFVDDKFMKTNGGATDKYSIGHFRGKETGKCMMFLYHGYSPILAIELEDETIYLNSKEEGQVLRWYELLRGVME